MLLLLSYHVLALNHDMTKQGHTHILAAECQMDMLWRLLHQLMVSTMSQERWEIISCPRVHQPIPSMTRSAPRKRKVSSPRKTHINCSSHRNFSSNSIFHTFLWDECIEFAQGTYRSRFYLLNTLPRLIFPTLAIIIVITIPSLFSSKWSDFHCSRCGGL